MRAFLLLNFLLFFSTGFLNCTSTEQEKEKNQGKEEDTDTFKFNFSCEYKDYKGTVKISSIEKDKSPSSFKDPVIVFFDFTPDDASASKSYRFTNFPDQKVGLTIAGGLHPSSKCLEKQGIKVGSEHKAVRREIMKGTCTPVIFTLTDFKEELCFEPEPKMEKKK
jgi:hypothetical protein